jgi:signal transduction histidine kinase
VLAHEINNCLVPITLYVQLLIENNQTSPASQPDLQVVLTAARRARQLVERVLEYARVPAASGASRPLDLRAAVDEALRLLRVVIPTDVELRVEMGEPCRSSACDPGLLVQLVINLCMNAVQAMRGRGGVLRVHFAEQSPADADPDLPPDAYLELCIADTGRGMDAALLEHAFEPYFSTGSGEMTGLGLAVSRSIARRIGGSIRLRSTPGQGTEVTVSIPVVARTPAG